MGAGLTGDYEALVSELIRGVDLHARKIGEKMYAPCDYLLTFSPHDLDYWEGEGLGAVLLDQLRRGVREYITKRDYQLTGGITIRIESDDQLDDGFLSLTVSFRPYDQQPHGEEGKTIFRGPKGSAIASFEVLNGTQRGQIFPITRFPANIGRISEHNHPTIGLEDHERLVGRNHASVVREGNLYFLLQPRDTLNGTKVNDLPVTPGARAALHDGAVVTLADHLRLRFHIGDSASTVTRRSS